MKVNHYLMTLGISSTGLLLWENYSEAQIIPDRTLPHVTLSRSQLASPQLATPGKYINHHRKNAQRL